MARKAIEAGLKVSMVTCDTDQPPNNDCSPFALLNVSSRLPMPEIFGTKPPVSGRAARWLSVGERYTTE